MHCLDKFKYCPACGSQKFAISSEKSRRCEDCGFEFFLNPSAAVAAFILNEQQELLVVRRAKEPGKGTLDLPGGFCDMGETVEEGMKREIKEETGLDVDVVKYLFSSPNVYQYSGLGVHTLDMDYLVRVPAGVEVHAADDAAECFWIPVDQINPADFGLTSIRNAIIRFLKEQPV